MFYCDSCHILQNPHEKEFHVVTQTRVRSDGGFETIKEIRVCSTCYAASNQAQQFAELQRQRALAKAIRKSNRVTEDDE